MWIFSIVIQYALKKITHLMNEKSVYKKWTESQWEMCALKYIVGWEKESNRNAPIAFSYDSCNVVLLESMHITSYHLCTF